MPPVRVAFRRLVALLFVALLLLAPGLAAGDSPVLEPAVAPPSAELRRQWALSEFYRKCLLVDDFPIVSSEKVSDHALREAAHVVRQMLAGREDVVRQLARNRVRLAVMAPSEFTLDIPEHADLKPAAYWNRRARGLGATHARPAVSCGEENVLSLAGDPYSTESILVHEFAHAIHEMALRDLDATFEKRLKEAFEASRAAGRWKGTYALSNPSEYWAEGVQSWFDTNRANDNQHNHVDTREELVEYDPPLAKLLAESFPDNAWRYTPTTKRADAPHLAGFDRSKAPRFAWPAKLVEEYKPFENKD